MTMSGKGTSAPSDEQDHELEGESAGKREKLDLGALRSPSRQESEDLMSSGDSR